MQQVISGFRMQRIALFAGSMFLAATAAWAGVPDSVIGAQVRANSTTAGTQSDPAIARDVDGDIVLVWTGVSGSDNGDIFVRRFTANGVAAGTDAKVNQAANSLLNAQNQAAVDMASDGSFVVVWQSVNSTTGVVEGVFGRQFNAAGTALGPSEFRIDVATPAGTEHAPSVAVDPSGNFVVVWQNLNQDGSGQGIFARRYNASGVAQGAPFQVNVTTASSQRNPSVAMDANGGFTIAWQSTLQDGNGDGVFARRFSSAGAPTTTTDVQVNAVAAGEQTQPAVAMSGTGRVIVAWVGPDTDQTGIFARIFDTTGAALTADIEVNGSTAGAQSDVSVSADADGDFVVAWTGLDAAGKGVYRRRFNSLGVPQTDEQAANSVTSGDQSAPKIALDADGDYAVVWGTTDTDAGDIALARFVGPNAVDLTLRISDSPDPAPVSTVIAPSAIRYDLTVNNTHPAQNPTGVVSVDSAVGVASGTRVVQQLPSELTFQSASGTGWTCGHAAGTVTCDRAEALARNSASTITVMANTPTTAPASRVAATSAIVSALQFDPDADDADLSNDDNSASADTAICGTGESPGSFAIQPVTVSESAGTATVQVTRTGGSCGPVTLAFQTADGTATAASDYTATSGNLNWVNGDTAAKSFTVTILEDDTDEQNETVRLSIGTPSRGTVGTAAADLRITDNDSPQIAFQATSQTVSEFGGRATTITVQSTEVASGADVRVNYSLSGTATNRVDYTATPSQIVIAEGQSSGTLTLQLETDSEVEGNETIVVTLLSAESTSGPVRIGTPSEHTVTVTDSTAPGSGGGGSGGGFTGSGGGGGGSFDWLGLAGLAAMWAARRRKH